MELFIPKGKVIKEIKPVRESEDNGIVISPTRSENKEKTSDEIKEIIAEDVLSTSVKEAALIHGISESSVHRYSKGETVKDPEIKARILDTRHGIENLALTKLMMTLDLINPHNVEKESDKVRILSGLSTVIDKLGSNQTKGGNTQVVHLELHMPKMKSEDDYEVINVTR